MEACWTDLHSQAQLFMLAQTVEIHIILCTQQETQPLTEERDLGHADIATQHLHQ
jgi:hypothetical protein